MITPEGTDSDNFTALLETHPGIAELKPFLTEFAAKWQELMTEAQRDGIKLCDTEDTLNPRIIALFNKLSEHPFFSRFLCSISLEYSMATSLQLSGLFPMKPTVPLSVDFSIPNVLHPNKFAYTRGYGQRVEVDDPDTFTLEEWVALIKEKLSPDETGYFKNSFVRIKMQNQKLDAFPKFLAALAIVFQEMIPKEPNVTVETDETLGTVNRVRALLSKFFKRN